MGLSIALPLIIGGATTGLQLLFAPRIKQPPIDKGKLDDIRITGADKGAYIPRFWGVVRIGGQWVFTSGVTHSVVQSPSSGGKGGPSAPSTRTHIYKISGGVLFARNEIDSFGKIWHNADILLDPSGNGSGEIELEAEDGTLTGGTTVVTSGGVPDRTSDDYVTGLGNGESVTVDIPLTVVPIDPTDGEPVEFTHLSFYYKSNADAVVNILINGTDTITKTFFDTGGDWGVQSAIYEGLASTVKYHNPSAAIPDLDFVKVQVIYEIIRFPQESLKTTGIIDTRILYPLDPIYPAEYFNYTPDADAQGTTVISSANGNLNLYTGSETQLQDPTLVAILDARLDGAGSDHASAMRGLTYFSIDQYQLRQASTPNWTAELFEGTEEAGDIVADVLEEVGLTSGDYDVSDIAGKTQLGFLDHTLQTRQRLLEPLKRWHQFRLAEIGTKIFAIDEDRASDYTIDPATDLRAHYAGSQSPTFDAEVTLREEHTTSKRYVVNFLNTDRQFHNDGQPSDEIFDTSATKTTELSFPIVAVTEDGKKTANVIHAKELAEDRAFELLCMPSMSRWSIGDVLTLPLAGRDHTLRIEQVRQDLPVGIMKIRGLSTEQKIYADPKNDRNTLPAYDLREVYSYPRNSRLVVVESKPLRETEKGRKGFYIAVGGVGEGKWTNAGLYRETSEDDYELQFIVDSPSPMCVPTNVLADHTPITSEDTTGSIDVSFFDDVELETVTQDDLDKNPTANLLRLGDEWIQFRTVTPVAIKGLEEPYRSAYTLSNLWRGRFDTGDETGKHDVGEHSFLATPALRFLDLSEVDEGNIINLKGVTNGQPVEVAPVVSTTFSGVLSDWSIGNESILRTLDADDVTIHELADALATLVKDNKLK